MSGDKKLTDLDLASDVSGSDLLYIVDVSDTTDDPGGSSRKTTVSQAAATIGLMLDLAVATLWINVKSYGAVGDGVTDDTAAFQAAEDVVAAQGGGTIYVPNGSYVKGRTFPPSRTTYIFDAAAAMIQKVGGSNLWRIQNDVEHVYFHCNGSLWTGVSGGGSAVFQFGDCKNSAIYNPNIYGSDTAKDGINITGTDADSCQNIRVVGGKVTLSDRNCISIVAGSNILIDGVECSYANTAPGAGIDVEMNNYGLLTNVTVQNCHLHHNGSSGLGGTFCDNVKVFNNHCHNNGSHGIAFTAGGDEFEDGKYRARDRRGVSNFDTATGNITASYVSDKGTDGLAVGTVVQFPVTGSGALPAELQAQVRWVVTNVDTTGNTFRVGQGLDYGELTSFSDAGSGTLDLDPEVSEVNVYCFVDGQSSNIEVAHNLVHDNVSTREISIGLSVNTWVHHNTVHVAAGSIGISLSFSRNATIEYNRVIYERDNAGITAGISASTAVNLKSRSNYVENCGGEAYEWAACAHMVSEDDGAYNCAHNGSIVYSIVGCPYSRYSNITLKTEDHAAETYGINADADSDSVIITGCDVMGVGTSNANSLRAIGSNTVTENNILMDGTIA